MMKSCLSQAQGEVSLRKRAYEGGFGSYVRGVRSVSFKRVEIPLERFTVVGRSFVCTYALPCMFRDLSLSFQSIIVS